MRVLFYDAEIRSYCFLQVRVVAKRGSSLSLRLRWLNETLVLPDRRFPSSCAVWTSIKSSFVRSRGWLHFSAVFEKWSLCRSGSVFLQTVVFDQVLFSDKYASFLRAMKISEVVYQSIIQTYESISVIKRVLE